MIPQLKLVIPDDEQLRLCFQRHYELEREMSANRAEIDRLAPLVWADRHPNQKRFLKLTIPEIRRLVEE